MDGAQWGAAIFQLMTKQRGGQGSGKRIKIGGMDRRAARMRLFLQIRWELVGRGKGNAGSRVLTINLINFRQIIKFDQMMNQAYNTCWPFSFCNLLIYYPQPSAFCPPPTPQPPTQELDSLNFEKLKLNLTAQDLQEAGYHNDRTPWAEHQDTLLRKLSKRNDLTWSQIADQIPNRTAKMCYSRFRRLSNQTKTRWTSQEDETIRDLVAKHGQDWVLIGKQLKGRLPKQLEQHYNYCLKPEINKSDWTMEEDLLLIELLEKYGKNWGVLEENMNGRTQHQIKNRYFGRLKKLQQRKEMKALAPE